MALTWAFHNGGAEDAWNAALDVIEGKPVPVLSDATAAALTRETRNWTDATND